MFVKISVPAGPYTPITYEYRCCLHIDTPVQALNANERRWGWGAEEMSPIQWLREVKAPKVLSRSDWADRELKIKLSAWLSGQLTDQEALAAWEANEKEGEWLAEQNRLRHAAWYARQEAKQAAYMEATYESDYFGNDPHYGAHIEVEEKTTVLLGDGPDGPDYE